MEPLNCTLFVQPDRAEMWVGTQVPVRAQKAVADATGLPPDKVIVNNLYMGGAFGRRLIAGAMVFSLGLGLMAHNNTHTFSYGYDKVRFIKPVFIGDTIYTIRTHLEKWPKYPTLGMVRVSYEVFKVPGELVLYCDHLQTVEYRNATSGQAQSVKD